LNSLQDAFQPNFISNLIVWNGSFKHSLRNATLGGLRLYEAAQECRRRVTAVVPADRGVVDSQESNRSTSAFLIHGARKWFLAEKRLPKILNLDS
jgi:hypothetical protein